MIRDPLAEVLEVALRTGDDAEPGDLAPADVAALHLARRRFGVALPPPYVPVPADPAAVPIRRAAPGDGAAIAVVQRRAWRVHYRGLFPDDVLDGIDFLSIGPAWMDRVAVDPTPRHRLLVAGRPGEVLGMVDTGPTGDDDRPDRDDTGEVRTLYVDPSVVGQGLGSLLLAAAVDRLAAAGFRRATLWVVDGNHRARTFYERWGWAADGARQHRRVLAADFDEVRYVLPRLPSGS